MIELMLLRDLGQGQTFWTALTNRMGIVLETDRGRGSVLVEIDGRAVALAPNIKVRIRPDAIKP